MKSGVSFSDHQEAFYAGAQATRGAIEQSGIPTLLVVFTTVSYDSKQLLAGIKSVANNAKIIGFCCGGIIAGDEIHQRGVGICSLSGDFRVMTMLLKGLSENPWGVGCQAGKKLAEQDIEKGSIIVLPDGFQTNMSEMLRGLYSQIGPDFKYIGGGAGDNLKFFQTYQFTENEIASDSMALAILDGLEICTGIGHGWKPMGHPITISKVSGKTVFEMDNMPAFHVYSKMLGGISKKEFAYEGMMHPLGFPDITGQYIIRDPFSVNDDDSISFVTEIPSQAVGNIMECNIPDLITTAGTAAYAALNHVSHPGFALIFDCISRILLMGDHFKEEIAAVKKALGKDVPLLGALTFGEIGSYSDVPLLHNKTIVVAVGNASQGTKNV